MQNIAAARLRSQAVDLNSMIASIRGYYSSAVVGRILGNHGKDTQVIHNYETVRFPSPPRCRWNWAASSPTASPTSATASYRTIRSVAAHRTRSTSSKRTR
jgi:hypothetical protein